ncbi:hypothetical protein ACTFIW_004606 [Dictyostelium discoideum]
MATTQYLDRERSKSVSYDHSKKSISSDDYLPKHNNNNNNNINNNKNPLKNNMSSSGSNVSSKNNNYNNSINNNNNNNDNNYNNSYNNDNDNDNYYNNKYNNPTSNRVYGSTDHHYFNTRRHKKFNANTIDQANGASLADSYSNKENNINSSNNSTYSNSSFNGNNITSTPTSNTNAPITNSQPTNATSPNKSRMKRLSLTVSISTQMYLEKMGKTSSAGTDSDDIKKMKNTLSELKKDCKIFTKNGKNTMFALDKVNNGFGESIQEFGNGMLKSTDEGEALRILGEQITEFDQSMKEGVIGCLGQFIEPLAEFYDEDLKKARELKRKQNLIRIRYEQSQSNLVDVKKKNDTFANKTLQAKSDEEECRKNYTSITDEFLKKMVENEKTFKLEIRKQIRDYVAMQVEFYREALENWEEFAEEMDEIIPPTDDEIKSQEESMKKKLENDDDEDDDDDNDDDLLADL